MGCYINSRFEVNAHLIAFTHSAHAVAWAASVLMVRAGRLWRGVALVARFGSGRCITVSINAFSALTKFFTPSRVRSGIGMNGNGATMFMARPAAFMPALT